MKYLLFTFIIICNLLKAQNLALNDEEFNYCLKGYPSQIEKGLDAVKNGYKIQDTNITFGEDGYIYHFVEFRNTTNELRAIIGIKQRNGKKIYFIIPHPNTYLNESMFLKCRESIGYACDFECRTMVTILTRLSSHFAFKN